MGAVTTVNALEWNGVMMKAMSSDLSFVVGASFPCARRGHIILRVLDFVKSEAELFIDNIVDIPTEFVLGHVYLQRAFIRVIIVDCISWRIYKVRVASVLVSTILWWGDFSVGKTTIRWSLCAVFKYFTNQVVGVSLCPMGGTLNNECYSNKNEIFFRISTQNCLGALIDNKISYLAYWCTFRIEV